MTINNMTDKSTRWLTYKEELALAVFFSNVEKFKCLSALPNFKTELLTEPMRIGKKDDAPLATILACWKILYATPGNEGMAAKNEAIIGMIRERCGIDITDEIDLSKYNPDGPGDILKYKEYGSLLKWVLSIRESGYAPGRESWDQLKTEYGYVTNRALREQHLSHLGKPFPIWQKEIIMKKMREEIEKERRAYMDRQLPATPQNAKEFIDDLDRPGTIIALFDEGKLFYTYADELESVIRYILTETKHITLRVGGYSYRVERQALDISKELDIDPCRLESIYCGYFEPHVDHLLAKATFRELKEYAFDYDNPFVRYAEEYDYKCFAIGGVTHSMVYYYVNNIDTGWYDKDGKFCGFYDKHRGLEALGDVVMIRGYQDIKPANAAIFTDSGRHFGDEIYCGPAAHFDKRDRTSSQRKLFEGAHIPFIDLGKNQ